MHNVVRQNGSWGETLVLLPSRSLVDMMLGRDVSPPVVAISRQSMLDIEICKMHARMRLDNTVSWRGDFYKMPNLSISSIIIPNSNSPQHSKRSKDQDFLYYLLSLWFSSRKEHQTSSISSFLPFLFLFRDSNDVVLCPLQLH